MIFGLLPVGLPSVIANNNIYLNQLVEIMPTSMVSGTYIQNKSIVYGYFGGSCFDIRFLFLPSALFVMLVCVPIVFHSYCRHQVKS